MPGARKAPRLWPAEPVKRRSIVPSGSPRAPNRFATSPERRAPTGRRTVRVGGGRRCPPPHGGRRTPGGEEVGGGAPPLRLPVVGGRLALEPVDLPDHLVHR